MKPIRLSAHARGYLLPRGFTAAEVEEAIQTSPWQPAELGRLECRKDFPYGRDWNGEFYATKQVRPVFVDEAAEIVVVTVYTYYFQEGASMKLSYDPEVDAAYVRFLDGAYECTTVRLSEDVAVNIAAGGKVVGIEILDASVNLDLIRSAPKIVLENLTAA